MAKLRRICKRQIPKAEEKSCYPMSSGQQRMYIINKIEENEILYNMPMGIILKKKLMKEKIQQSVTELVKRYEILRTSFHEENGILSQKIDEETAIKVAYETIESSPDYTPLEILSDFTVPFRLEQAPLLRVKVVDIKGTDRSLLLLDMHHIISDDVTINLIFAELLALYEGESLDEPSLQYKDYCQWMATRDLTSQKEYWLQQFSGEIPMLELPVDYHRSQTPSVEGAVVSGNISGILKQKIENKSKQNQMTEFMLFLSAAMIMLSKYSRQEDIILGTPVSIRTHKEIEDMPGLLVNTLAMRGAPQAAKSFTVFLNEMRDSCLNAFENKEYPLDELIDNLKINRYAGRNPLFDVMFVYQERADFDLEELLIEAVISESRVSKFDLMIEVTKDKDGYTVNLQYRKDLFKRAMIERMGVYFQVILERISQASDCTIGEIESVTRGEADQIFHIFNQMDTAYPKEKTIIQVFEEQVIKTPDQIALVYQNEQINYRELNQKANLLACKLRIAGVNPNDYVAMLMRRSTQMVIAILGILKSGGAYVPIDPAYPASRIDYLLMDSKPKLLLTYRARFETDIPVIDLECDKVWDGVALAGLENQPIFNTVDNIAYVIYTSGTTGSPKGVMVSHKNLIRLFKPDNFQFNFTQTDVWMMFHSYCFDFSVWEMYGALLYGGKLIIVPQETVSDAHEVLRIIKEKQVTILNQVPSAFYSLMLSEQQESMASVRYLIFGGEALKPQKLEQWHQQYPNVKIVNMYGITEGTVHVTYKEINEEQIAAGISNIGRAIPTMNVYVMNGKMLNGIGMPGELCISGDGVALGYLNRAELTAARFVENPYGTGKLYRTGDLARWLPSGDLEYLGRIDEQVKRRGYRIELGEIEYIIRKQVGICDALVIAAERNEDIYLCAYYVAKSDVAPDVLRAAIEKELPMYMAPDYYLQIQEIPLTSNSKPDYQALPEIAVKSQNKYAAPETEAESKICEAFKQVLGVALVGTRDDFFELGGNSLQVIRLINEIEQKTGVRLAVKTIFYGATPEHISRSLKVTDTRVYSPIPKAAKRDHYLMSSAQKRLYTIYRINENEVLYNLPFCIKSDQKLELAKVQQAVERLATRHEVLRTSFHDENGEMIQKIAEQVFIEVGYGIITAQTAIQKQQLLSDFSEPFQLEQAPLFRVKQVDVKDAGYSILFFDIHHIISDEVTMQLLLEDFFCFYQGKELEPLSLQYNDYSQWIQNQDFTKQKRYWLTALSGEIPVLDLPLDYPREQQQNFNGDIIEYRIEKAFKQQIGQKAKTSGVTDYMLFLSVVMILLSKYSRQNDIMVGTPVSVRTHKDTEKIAGLFVNTLVMRTKPENQKKYDEFLSEVKDTCLKAYQNQEYPFDELLEQLKVSRDAARNPLFDVMFVFQTMEKKNLENITAISPGARFDLTITIIATEDEYVVLFQYSKGLYRKASIQKMVGHFVQILASVCQQGDCLLGAIETMTKAEKQQILEQFNPLYMQAAEKKTIVEIFEAQAAQTPSQIALVFGQERLNYEELNRRSNILAHDLRTRGIKPNDRVAILAERSIEMIIGILGIIKAGGAYVPIDPIYPLKRINYILADCSPKVVLLYKTKLETNIPVIDLETIKQRKEFYENPPLWNTTDDLLYIIYTSGTTGNPKGVMIHHDNVNNLNMYVKKEFAITEKDHILQFSNIVFDAFIWEITMSILAGATLHLTKTAILLDRQRLEQQLADEKISIITLPPQYLSEINIENARLIITAGSEANRSIIESIADNCQYINAYGPTENTVCTSIWKYNKNHPIPSRIPIGKPISNVQVYILNEMELCGIGIPGELCTAGAGVARGYLNQDELSQQKFIANPYGAGTLYRTGDLARWLPDGNLEYLGRMDDQVKIRGFRIELGEIESVIRKQDGIRNAAAIVRGEKEEAAICAYIVTDPYLNYDFLLGEIKKELPDYMIPSHIMQIEKIPLTINGKVDRKALLKIVPTSKNKYVAPRDEIEKILCMLFENILKIEKVSINDNFFELGGDSIKAVRIAAKVREKGYILAAGNIMKYLSIMAISKHMVKLDEMSIDKQDQYTTIDSSLGDEEMAKINDYLEEHWFHQ